MFVFASVLTQGLVLFIFVNLSGITRARCQFTAIDSEEIIVIHVSLHCLPFALHNLASGF